MSISEKNVLFYENLPTGGAKLTFSETLRYVQKYYKVTHISEPNYRIKGFLHYLFTSLVISQKHQKKIIDNIKHDLLVVYHSWLVKTPSILRYSNKHKIYICHEPMREYYDMQHKASQNIKERIVNFLRLPIKILDRINVQARHVSIVANSEFSKKAIENAYGRESVVIYPGIDIKRYKNNNELSKENQVICVSAINKYKRQDFLVEVIAKLPKKLRPKLVLLGNGADLQYLKLVLSKADSLDVSIQVKENLSDREKIIQLHKSKVFVYCPINEPFGIVIEEALAAGLPILTYASGGGYNEIIDYRNGIILDNLDASSWAKNLELLLLDDKRAKKISKYNSEYATKYLDVKNMNKKIKELIDNLL